MRNAQNTLSRPKSALTNPRLRLAVPTVIRRARAGSAAVDRLVNTAMSADGDALANASPTALIQNCFREDETWVRQVIYQTGLTNSNLIELMKRVIPDRSVPIYADPTEPAWIEEIYQAGFNIHPADNSVKPGIDYCKRGRFYVDSGSPDLIKELGAYKYREDKNGNVLEIPVKFMDHGADGMRYGRYTHHLMGSGSVHADVL